MWLLFEFAELKIPFELLFLLCEVLISKNAVKLLETVIYSRGHNTLSSYKECIWTTTKVNCT